MIKRKNTGQLIIISAPSGAGKGSVISGLLERDKKNLWLSVSTTSRQPRTNDIPGVTYNFVSKEEFEKLIEEDYNSIDIAATLLKGIMQDSKYKEEEFGD